MADTELSPLGEELVEAMREVAAHARGELELPVRAVRVPQAVDVPRIRHHLKLSQRQFAERFGFALSTVRDWEQGRRKPDRSARILLRVIEKEWQAVERALTTP